jgi:glycosyltransferase involved in cell wall biosynthesis
VPECEAAEMVSAELSLADTADIVLTVSELEAAAFYDGGLVERREVYVVPHSVEAVRTPPPYGARSGFLFVGPLEFMGSPNVDSLLWFVREVLPLIRAGMGDPTKLLIAGINRTGMNFSDIEGVEHLGPVPNLQPLYDRAAVFIAPTRFAAGVPLKIYGAAAAGIPVVATTLLASQLGWAADRELCVADTPAEFAAACVRLHSDSALWARVREYAHQRVKQDCSAHRFRAALEQALATGQQGTSPMQTRAERHDTPERGIGCQSPIEGVFAELKHMENAR